MDKSKVDDWLIKAFMACNVMNAPRHLVGHYSQMICSNSLSFQDVQNELLMLTSARSQVTPNHQNVASSASIQPQKEIQHHQEDAHIAEKERILSQIQVTGGGTVPSDEDHKVKEYIDLLYVKYTGRKGDPASTNFLVNSIMTNTYTLNQAEYFIKFSKEAKAYVKVREKERVDKVHQFVKELFRVYAQNATPTDEEIQSYVDDLLTGVRNFQDVEDEFKLMSLAPPSAKPKKR